MYINIEITSIYVPSKRKMDTQKSEVGFEAGGTTVF